MDFLIHFKLSMYEVDERPLFFTFAGSILIHLNPAFFLVVISSSLLSFSHILQFYFQVVMESAVSHSSVQLHIDFG